jgi:hypothetical protein
MAALMPVKPAPRIATGVRSMIVAELMPKDGASYHHFPDWLERPLQMALELALTRENP